MIDLTTLTIRKAHEAIKNGEYTALNLTEAYLGEIEKKNEELNAYLEVFEDARGQAEKADQMFKDGSATLMTGVPVAIKDNILFKGHRAGAASKILDGFVATYNSNVVKKLKEAGAVILGRTNMDEFAMGASTENSAYGVTRNPADLDRVPGGSSGGSAAAVAADMCLVALGSDTAGSIRQPSAYCGVVGLKPTYGSVSRSGLIALGSSLDIIGPIAKNIEDAEIVYEAIKGKDELDSTSIPDDLHEKKDISKPVIGLLDVKDIFGISGDNKLTSPLQEVMSSTRSVTIKSNKNFVTAVKKLESLGYKTKIISLPHMKYAVPAYYFLLPAEASANLARFDGVKYGHHKGGENLIDDYFKTRGEGFGTEVKRRILLGTYVLSAGYHDAYYNKATAVRGLIMEDYKKAFEDVDIVLTPTTAGPAFKLGEKVDNPVAMYLEDIFTVPANHTGLPAISVPSGALNVDGKELPLGIQLMAPHGREDLLFNISKDFLR